jgi:hypothetical protein
VRRGGRRASARAGLAGHGCRDDDAPPVGEGLPVVAKAAGGRRLVLLNDVHDVLVTRAERRHLGKRNDRGGGGG